MLIVKKLKKYFGGVRAVDNCDFEIQKGTITALIGPNGAGKSTVLNLISGILKPDSGKIIFDEKDITGSSIEKISNLGISRLFQQTRLFNNLTVRENLLLAFDNQDTKFWKNLIGEIKIGKKKLSSVQTSKEKKIKEMLELINLEKFENTLARDLSYGQKRLVALIRTILSPHKLLMLDEPVAGVNPKLRSVIAEVLLKLKGKGEAILLIEHDMNFAFGVSNEVIVMDEGKVIAKGKPEQIRNNPKVLEAYWGE
jgi:ABC-type branched-subunit amino acid transport system ATPase component